MNLVTRLLNKQIQACPEEDTGLTEASMAHLYHIWDMGCRMLVTVDRGLGKLFDLRAVLNVFEKGRQEGMQAVDLRCETVRKRQQCRKGTVKLETDLLDLSQLCQFLAVLLPYTCCQTLDNSLNWVSVTPIKSAP